MIKESYKCLDLNPSTWGLEATVLSTEAQLLSLSMEMNSG